MKLFINNVEKDILDGASVSYRADDTLDSAVVQMVNDSYIPIDPFTLATIKFDNTASNNELMWIAQDSVSIEKKGASPVYRHTLQLVELTKILEKFFVPNMTLTGKDFNTLLNEFVRVGLNINDCILKNTSISFGFIGASIGSKLMRAEAEDFVFSNSTLREIFDEMFSCIDCRVIVSNATYDSYNTLNLTIDGYDLNNTTSATMPTNIVGTESNNNADTFSGNIVCPVSNALSENYIRQIDTFKVKTTTATSSDYMMSLAYGIEWFSSFKISYLGEISLGGFFGTESQSIEYVNKNVSGMFVDASLFLMDKEYWDTLADDLGTINDPHKRTAIYYTRGQNEVDASRTYKSMFLGDKTIVSAIVSRAYDKYFSNHLSEVPEISGKSCRQLVVHQTFPSLDITKVSFDITYQPRMDGLVIQSKADSDLSIIDNQNANVVDLTRLGGALRGKLNRLGNNELFLDCQETSYSAILQPLRYLTINNDKYVIYQTDIGCYKGANEFYQVRYYLTKDWNNINEKTSIKRAKRIYDVALTGYQTIVPKKITIKVGVSSHTSDTESIVCKGLAKSLCGNSWNKIENAICNCRRWNNNTLEDDNFTLPAIAFGSGNTLNLIAKFYDNFSAGLSVEYGSGNPIERITWVGGKKVLFNPYVSRNSTNRKSGYAEQFTAKFGCFTSRTGNGLKTQPITDTTEYNNYFTDLVGANPLTFNWRKDSSEAIVLQAIYSIVSDDPDVVVGDKLASINRMVLGSDMPALKVYSRTTPYKQGEKNVGSSATELSNTNFICGKYSNTWTISKHSGEDGNIAITNSNGDILLAVNNWEGSNAGVRFYEV